MEQAEPPRPKSLQSAPLGGLGIPLVRKLSESVRYEQPPQPADQDGFLPRNRIVVTFVRSQGPAAEG